MDFSKAFDMVPHSTILDALQQKFCVDNGCLYFIHHFLSNRLQRVVASGHACEYVEVTSGVPQGSLLGPLLFAVVTNSLEVVSDNTSLVAYADDITLIHHVLPNGTNLIQDEFENLKEWASTLGLRINAQKTKVMTIRRGPLLQNLPSLSLNGTPIERVDSIKILGIIFDFNLKWKSQVSSVVNKCSKAFGLVRKVANIGCSDKDLSKLYIAFVYSIMAYAIPVYIDMTTSEFNALELFDRKFSRLCRTKSHMKQLRQRFQQIIIRLMGKIAANYENHPLSKFFIRRSDDSFNLRTRNSLFPIIFKTNLSIKSFLSAYKYS